MAARTNEEMVSTLEATIDGVDARAPTGSRTARLAYARHVSMIVSEIAELPDRAAPKPRIKGQHVQKQQM